MGSMYQLAIFDRDEQETAGIQWLISKYAFPISHIDTANQVSAVVEWLEKNPTDILCIELDMIPDDKWEMVRPYIQTYSKQVIAMTAEATFERAMQALTIQAIDLWIKPLSPSQIKQTMQHAIRHLSSTAELQMSAPQNNGVHYESLLTNDQKIYMYPVYLLKPEARTDLDLLRKFLDQFDFYDEPTMLSMSDEIVLVFHRLFPDPYLQAHRLLREWESVTGRSLAIVVYEHREGLSLHEIYLFMKKEMEKTFFTGYQQVFHTHESTTWIDIDPFLTMEEQREWVKMLENSDRAGVKTWLYQDFFDIEPPYPEPGLLRTRLTSILAQIRRFMIQKGLVERDEAYQKIFHAILYEPVLYRIVQNLMLFLYDLFQLVEEKQHAFDVVDMAVNYIEEHYADPNLSLTDVAEHVQRSSSYLSYLLSHRQEQSFKQLLLNVRMEKAKELLLFTDDPIQLIATKVGFNNPNYFSKVFKFETGLSPRDYKQQMRLSRHVDSKA